MGELFLRIRQLVGAGRYVIGVHASERLEGRGVLEWQIVDGLETAGLIRERVRSQPHPSIEVEQILADGTRCKAVWSYL